jgi:proton-coupled amino acid transporter
MASPRQIDSLATNPAKRRASSSVQPGTSPSVPNIPPRTGTPSSNGQRPLASSLRPSNSLSSRPLIPTPPALTPKPSVDALVVDKTTPSAQQVSSALTAQLGTSPTPDAPARTPPIPSSVSRKGSASLKPDMGRTMSGSSTPRANDSSFSDLVEVSNEEKARILGKHLVSAGERSTRGTTSPSASPAGKAPEGDSGVSGYGSVEDPGQGDERFPIPYDAPGGDVTWVL